MGDQCPNCKKEVIKFGELNIRGKFCSKYCYREFKRLIIDIIHNMNDEDLIKLKNELVNIYNRKKDGKD